ncbi:hypothetical protein F4861DRAFT_544207 [Xylaria intraflava]|nr:hypothetical protein F4861DRAFT_544207 [Xylaria intraflava]
MVSKQNRARHQAQHEGNHKIMCSVCKIKISKAAYQQHRKTKQYKEKERLANHSIITQQPIESPVTFPAHVEPYYQEFLQMFQGGMATLSAAYVSQIKQWGGIQDMASQHQGIYTSFGVPPPSLLPVNECWLRKPADEAFLSELVEGFKKQPTDIYMSGMPHEPTTKSIDDVVHQLRQPVMDSAFYAVNLEDFKKSAVIKMPESLEHLRPWEGTLRCIMNITPKFTTVDLHIDFGTHGLTLLALDCVKLWAIYPLTPENFRVFSQHYHSNNRFLDMASQLTKGDFFIQTVDEAMYLPPGCIHSTVTIRGGLVPGAIFISVESLAATEKIWNLDWEKNGEGKEDTHSEPFLKALTMAFEEGTRGERKKAQKILCKNYKKLVQQDKKGVRKLVHNQKTACVVCGKEWKNH